VFDLEAARDSNCLPGLGLKLPIREQSITFVACSKSFSPNRSIDGSTACVTRRPDVVRMYYARRGDILIVMLGGGTKGTQARDIEKAIALAETIEE